MPGIARAQSRSFTFAYDQPRPTGYGILADIFNDKLKALSKGTLSTEQFPGAQLGQEPQLLQKVRSGDIDFIISSTANASTLAPESGVFSLHYLFSSEAHLAKAIADPAVVAAVRAMYAQRVQGAQTLCLATLGLRYIYSKKEIRKVDDLKGVKVRVQATKTEDTHFPAYGAQVVHMPFGDVYTSLQTGVVDAAENGVNVYLSNKHYEVAPVLSWTQHEANNSVVWVSDKVWNSLGAEQQGWVQEAANTVGREQPARALKLEEESAAKLEKIGVKLVRDTDKSGFIKIAAPIQDQLAKELGPNAEKILALVRGIK
jgi:tripartite ATP-independent transporter DctP family solute receptor